MILFAEVSPLVLPDVVRKVFKGSTMEIRLIGDICTADLCITPEVLMLPGACAGWRGRRATLEERKLVLGDSTCKAL